MLTIQGEHGSALDGDDHLAVMKMRDAHLLHDMLEGACDDDCERTAPYLHVCPEETGFQNGAPIYLYGGVTPMEDDRFASDFEAMMRLGFEFSATTTIAAYRREHDRNETTGLPLTEEEIVDRLGPDLWTRYPAGVRPIVLL